MADRHVDHLLIGGGLAAGNCARWLRESGAEGSILLVGREPDLPYNRPPCSKEYLQGAESRDKVLFRPPEWYEEQRIEVLTRCSAMKLDVDARSVKLSTKEEVEFGQALLATGANVRRLNVDGRELEGIHYLRTLGNSDTIREDAAGKRVVLIGGSYIGSEVAASLTTLGSACTIVMLEPVTLSRTFGETAGRFFQDRLEEHGVVVHGGDELERFEGADGRVTTVVTKSGLSLEADAVVIGAGAVPDVTLARGAGLQLGERGGVIVDSRLATAVSGLYAAGDIAEYESVVHGGARVRIEHWDVAFNQGKTVALNMLGRDLAHDVVPYFFSDLADWASLEYVGPALSWDTEVIRGSIDDGEFSVWYIDGDGRLAAALSVGRSDDLEHARRLIASQHELGGEGAQALGDLSSDLGALGRVGPS
jgi:3-phenylpropionate/trans-cinnamate dioxygenase ferredoxin reductase subunit